MSMKKNLFFCFATTLLLVGCGKSEPQYEPVTDPKDINPAIAEITTSLGNSWVVNSVNGSGYNVSGANRATEQKNELSFRMYKEETATIHFYCNSCNYDVIETVNAPFAKMFACNCPDDIDNSSTTVREYLSITALLP